MVDHRLQSRVVDLEYSEGVTGAGEIEDIRPLPACHVIVTAVFAISSKSVRSRNLPAHISTRRETVSRHCAWPSQILQPGDFPSEAVITKKAPPLPGRLSLGMQKKKAAPLGMNWRGMEWRPFLCHARRDALRGHPVTWYEKAGKIAVGGVHFIRMAAPSL